MNSNESLISVRVIIITIILAFTGVLIVGLSNQQPMIGDEVTHYYMLVTQAEKLPAPNVEVRIPLATGTVLTTYYPHVFLWHYIGAVLWKMFGESFCVVQLYHSLFFVQFLIAGWLLIRNEEGDDSWITCVYVIILASLPVCLLLSVAFYQDIPVIAQMLMSFMFLRKHRMWWSLFFMALALSIKITIFLMLPVYFLCIGIFYWQSETKIKLMVRIIIAVLIITGTCMPMAYTLNKMGWTYYPTTILRLNLKRMGFKIRHPYPVVRNDKSQAPAQNLPVANQPKTPLLSPPVSTGRKVQVCHHPGDLRKPVNFLVYGGGLLWLVTLMAIVGMAFRSQSIVEPVNNKSMAWWTIVVGGWYLVTTAYYLRTSPDARFFLPAIPFILIPLVRLANRLPLRKISLVLIFVAALIQGSVVLAKTSELRHVRKGVMEAISFLKEHPMLVFMYPEGNYRLFPCKHEWYLNYQLREFWKNSNDNRINMLHKFYVKGILIKKYLIGKLDKDMNDLGIYPDYFVRDIEQDKRFKKVFENEDVVIYLVPPISKD